MALGYTSSMRFVAVLLANLKSTMAVLLGVGLIGMTLNRLVVAMTERAPSPVHLDQWTAEYHGQHWIELTGIAKPEWSTRLGGYEYIPVVATDYHEGDPIHVVILTEPRDLPGSGPITVAGTTEEWNLNVALPRLPFDPKAVRLIAGATAKVEPSMEIFSAVFAVFFICVGVHHLRQAWREGI